MNKTNNSLLVKIEHASDQQTVIRTYLKANANSSKRVDEQSIHFYNQAGESLKIQTVRQLIRDCAYATNPEELQYLVLLYADKASLAAQNALLKIVEEPPANTQIILAVSDLSKILPTIKSRCLTIRLDDLEDEVKLTGGQKVDQEYQELLQELPQLSHSKAIKLAEKYKDREEAKKLILALLKYCSQKTTDQYCNKPAITQEFLLAKQLLDRNINIKLVLENCFFKIRDHK